jgi:hypothetical protein
MLDAIRVVSVSFRLLGVMVLFFVALVPVRADYYTTDCVQCNCQAGSCAWFKTPGNKCPNPTCGCSFPQSVFCDNYT